MALPKTIEKASKDFNEYGDCAVKAVAIACEVPYKVAHKALEKEGRGFREGTYPFQTYNAIHKLGKVTKQTHKFKSKTITTLARELPCEGSYLVHVRDHVLACKDGKVLDWTEGRRNRILSIHEVIEA